MPIRISRWTCLCLFALINLVIWLAIALSVGTLAGDGVNIGFEKFVREQQATAVAYVSGSELLGGRTVSSPLVAVTPTPLPEAKSRSVRGAGTSTPEAPSSLPLEAPSADQAGTEGEAKPDAAAEAASTSLPTTVMSETGFPRVAVAAQLPLMLSNPGFADLMRDDNAIARLELGRPVEIRYQEDALNRELAMLLAEAARLPYHDMRVHLKRDQVIVVGQVTLLGFEVRTQLIGNLLARDCAPQMNVQAITVGSFLTPGFVKDGVTEIITKALNWFPPDAPMCVEHIAVEEGALVLAGSTR